MIDQVIKNTFQNEESDILRPLYGNWDTELPMTWAKIGRNNLI